MILLWANVLKREPYDLFSVLRQKRKAEFASARAYRDGPAAGGFGAARDAPHKGSCTRRGADRGACFGRRSREAADEYRVFVDEFGTEEPTSVLSRGSSLRLAEHLMHGRSYLGAGVCRVCRAYQFDRKRRARCLSRL